MPTYTPPAGNAVDFELDDYTPPAGNAVDFDLSESGGPDPGPDPDVGAVGSFRGFSTNHRLERIYAAVSGHEAPSIARDTHFLMSRIGQVRGLNLTSGYKSFETHLIVLYEDLTGNTWTGSKSAELILRAIEAEL